jgi:RHS repeat-associated protein
MQTTAAGGNEEVCYSYPFGDGLTCTGTDATEHHFTGKERDAESGNDYFMARYYSSNMGRFLSPDWAAKAMPVPYATFGNPQSLNLYSYMQNNPLGGADADGHWPDFVAAAITVMNYIQSHPAVAAALAKIGGSFSGKVNAGVGVEESVGGSGLKGSVAASATGFYQLSKNGLTTGSDIKLGASIETPLTGKLSIGGTSETISKENDTELAPPGKTENSTETGIGSFTNDEKTFSIGDETGAGPDLGAELDVDKAQFSSGLSDLGSALSNSFSDLVQTAVTAGEQLISPAPMPTENPAVPPQPPAQQNNQQ